MRKASDVILAMEQDIKELKAMIKNQDLLLKLILKSTKIDNTGLNVKQTPLVTQAKPILPGLKSNIVMGEHGLQNKEENDFEFPQVISNKPIELEENLKQENIIGKRRTNRYNEDINSNKTIPVKQKILYPDGKLVCLAGVEIFDIENKNIIQKIRTNAMGEWNTSLKPGQYHVNILKPKALNKPEIKLSFGIDIPMSSGPVELPTPENT